MSIEKIKDSDSGIINKNQWAVKFNVRIKPSCFRQRGI